MFEEIQFFISEEIGFGANLNSLQAAPVGIQTGKERYSAVQRAKIRPRIWLLTLKLLVRKLS